MKINCCICVTLRCAYLSKLLSMFVFAHSGCDIERCTLAAPTAAFRCRLPSSPNKSNGKSLSDRCNEVDATNGFSLPLCCSSPNGCCCCGCCWRNISKIVRTSFLMLISILSRRVDSSFICVVIELRESLMDNRNWNFIQFAFNFELHHMCVYIYKITQFRLMPISCVDCWNAVQWNLLNRQMYRMRMPCQQQLEYQWSHSSIRTCNWSFEWHSVWRHRCLCQNWFGPQRRVCHGDGDDGDRSNCFVAVLNCIADDVDWPAAIPGSLMADVWCFANLECFVWFELSYLTMSIGGQRDAIHNIRSLVRCQYRRCVYGNYIKIHFSVYCRKEKSICLQPIRTSFTIFFRFFVFWCCPSISMA